MLRKLMIKNFKSVYDNTIDLGRINVFIGENGCGKTNILEAVAMAGASKALDLNAEGIYNRGVRVARPNLTFSSFTRLKPNSKITINLEFQILDEKFVIPSTLYCEDKNDIYAKWKDESLIYQIDETEIHIPQKSKKHIAKDLIDYAGLPDELYNLTQYLIFNLDIKSLRGIKTESKKIPLGINGESLDILLSEFTHEERNQLMDYSFMVSWLDDIIIDKKDALKFQGHKLGRSHSLLYFKDKFMRKKDMNNIFAAENANDGVLHILFYLSLFISDKTPSFFAIDNIEANLNPAVSRSLIKALARLSLDKNKQVLITTHNPAVLDGLNLNDDEQRIFVVYRNDTGKTSTKRIKLKPQSDEKLKLSEMWMRGYLGGLPRNF
jgi:AAA15 family ATPase/GTPase